MNEVNGRVTVDFPLYVYAAIIVVGMAIAAGLAKVADEIRSLTAAIKENPTVMIRDADAGPFVFDGGKL